MAYLRLLMTIHCLYLLLNNKKTSKVYYKVTPSPSSQANITLKPCLKQNPCWKGPSKIASNFRYSCNAYISQLMHSSLVRLHSSWPTNLPRASPQLLGIPSFLHPHRSPAALRHRNMASSSSALAWTPHCYPHTRRSDHVDVYRSAASVEVKVSDPYAWLEKDGEEQEKWLAAQEALARNFLDAHPDRIRLEKEIRASTDYEKVSTPLDKVERRHIVAYHSSDPPHCGTMVDGTGLITAAFRRNQVCVFWSIKCD
jgi:hypothetical protein